MHQSVGAYDLLGTGDQFLWDYGNVEVKMNVIWGTCLDKRDRVTGRDRGKGAEDPRVFLGLNNYARVVPPIKDEPTLAI